MLCMLPLASQRTPWFSSSSGNNQWWAIPGRKQKHFDWQVVLEGTEGVHRNDDEGIDAEYISWIFFLTCSRLPVTAKALWVHPPSSCTLRPPSRAWCVRASRSCLSHLCSWSKLDGRCWATAAVPHNDEARASDTPIAGTYNGGVKLKPGSELLFVKCAPQLCLDLEGKFASILCGKFICCKSVKQLRRGSFFFPFVIFCFLYYGFCFIFSLTAKLMKSSSFLNKEKDC